ncbi:MAG TPA: TonB-dependent receptor plug domain-containing protein [Sphingomicrobium sp.]|nr:TonB-dependent receptor plug domain-containing protein [Sphingomicrobium sp.]
MSCVGRLSTMSAALVATSAVHAQAQPRKSSSATPPAAAPTSGQTVPTDEEDEDIVVTGRPPRGSVVGDIPPVNVLDSHDVRATGASSFDELLEAIAPDIGVARGSGSARPLVLLNGRRVSSYRELRDIPIEAVSRVDILPDEVALRYGYPPDQKVVNVVLQNRFAETVVQAAANAAAHEGFAGGSGDLTRILLTPKRRTTLNLHAGTDDILKGAQRSIVEQQYESSGTGATGLLLPPELGLRGTMTLSRQLPGDVDETFNAQAAHSNGHLLSGLSEQLPAELRRHTLDDNLHLGSTLSGDGGKWYWNVAANGDIERNRTSTTDLGQAFAPGNAQSTHIDGNLDATANGPLFATPAGVADVTLRAAGAAEYLDIDEQHFANAPVDSKERTTATAAASIDLPLSHRGRAFNALGNLTLNANGEINRLSDFGTLTRVGAGANWSPIGPLNLLGSWDHEERAPSVRQLGDPFVETPGTRIFDFTNGVVNRVAVVTGGNPGLRTARRDTLDLSAAWKPFETGDFRVRGDYAHVTIDQPISNITVFPTIEEAFPDRFVRDASGNLVSVDLRPVNFASAHRDTLLLGFDFTKPLKSHRVTTSEIQRAVDRARAAGIAVPQSAGESANAAPGSLASGATNGRLSFSLTDTITFVDRATIAPGLPELDYLHGAPVGQTGGQPRHQIQAQAGWSNNGFGARFGATWRSPTRVDTATDGPLHFSPVATFDLRLFANVGQYLPIVSRHPWLRGASMRFEVGNIFNTRPRVRNGTGAVPIGFEPSMLDPLGRTIMFSFRKQFLPASFYQQQLQKFQKQQSQQP